MTIVCISGGFDPLHVGHMRHIQEARNYGDVVVILNSDAWLKKKKGYVFMPYEERKEILMGIAGVFSVVPVDDSDGTVLKALRRINPTFYCKGGDRGPDNTPEIELCMALGITPVFDVGGGKDQASSVLVRKAAKELSGIGSQMVYPDGV